MSSRTRKAVAGGVAALGVGVALVALASRRGAAPPRRLAPVMNTDGDHEALREENIRRWAHKAGSEPEKRSLPIGSHGSITAYRSSAAEMVWLDGARRGHICKTAELPAVEAAARHWMSYSKRAYRPGGAPAPEPTPEEKEALSHFHVGPFREGHAASPGSPPHYAEPIEPLHGVARHPFARVGCRHSTHPHDVDKYNIEYLIIHNQCGRPGPKPRTLLFDMGASVGFNGVKGGIYDRLPEHAGALTPSLPLFYRIYEDRCLEPDEIYAWEPNPKVSGEEWFGELPARLRAKVHFYNGIVNEGELSQAEAHGPHPTQSFLEILEATAQPDDFVAVKVDIDTPFAELTIVEAIADRPEIASLIDELFFEYHFYFDGMNFGWGHSNLAGDVDAAVGLMHRLRALGIRSHFWI